MRTTIEGRSNDATVLYDGGAWVGWNDSAKDWATVPRLRWRHVNTLVQDAGATAPATANLTGGYETAFLGSSSPTLTVNLPVFSATAVPFRRGHILDEYRSDAFYPRRAVGPRVPETRAVILNLTLPQRLRG